MFVLLQTPEVQSVLQAAEEPEQHGEEQGGAGRSSRQRLQRAAAAHGAARRLALRADSPTEGSSSLDQLICSRTEQTDTNPPEAEEELC